MNNLESKFWKELWQNDDTPWDLGKEHPYLESVLQTFLSQLNDDQNIASLVPGCGRGHDAAFLARKNLGPVTGWDISELAVKAARALYSEIGNLNFATMNALEVAPDYHHSFDVIFDQAMLCALTRLQQVKYLAACQNLLKEGGHFISICFTKVSEEIEGPPFALQKQEILELFSKGFTLGHFRDHEAGARQPAILEEAAMIWRKG